MIAIRWVVRCCFWVFVLCSGLCVQIAPAQANRRVETAHDGRLRRFLRRFEEKAISVDEQRTRYAAASADLNDDGSPDVIVYLIGRSKCGSGGCTALILTPQGSSYKVVTRITIAQLPIRVLSTRTNGWRDLSVRVRGGGIQPGYESMLKFDGRKYPGNPSVPPALRLRRRVDGIVVIPSKAEGTPLYSR